MLNRTLTPAAEDNRKPGSLRFPAMSLGAEILVQGYLMRRNILTYKAPPNHEGYDLICIHPDPRREPKALRIQVKSRYATDCDRGFPVKAKTIGAFDYLVVVFLNVGYFFKRSPKADGRLEPEFYTLPPTLIERHHNLSTSWQKVSLRGLGTELKRYRNENGFELIAQDLGIEYPARKRGAPDRRRKLEVD